VWGALRIPTYAALRRVRAAHRLHTPHTAALHTYAYARCAVLYEEVCLATPDIPRVQLCTAVHEVCLGVVAISPLRTAQRAPSLVEVYLGSWTACHVEWYCQSRTSSRTRQQHDGLGPAKAYAVRCCRVRVEGQPRRHSTANRYSTRQCSVRRWGPQAPQMPSPHYRAGWRAVSCVIVALRPQMINTTYAHRTHTYSAKRKGHSGPLAQFGT